MLKKIPFPLILVVITSLPLALPWLHPGLLAVGDGTAHLFRQLNYHQAILDGQIPPRWASLAAHNLGAPIFIYNWFLPYTLIELFLLIGISLVNSVRIFNIFCLLVGPVGMYFWARKFSSPWPAAIASILFAWAPYRLISVNLYGAWGEMLALTIVPFLGLALTNLSEKRTARNLFFSSVLTASLITAHNLSALIYLPLLFALVLLWQTKKSTATNILVAYLFGIILTSFFWLPAIFRSSLIQYDFLSLYTAAVNEYGHFPTLSDDLYHAWYQLTSPRAIVWYKDFTLGFPLFLAAFMDILLVAFKRKVLNGKILIATLILGLTSYFLTVRESLPIWELGPLKIITYSYRFLAPATILLTISAAIVVHCLGKKFIFPTLIVFLMLSLQAGRLYLTPATGYLNVDKNYLSGVHQSLHPPNTGFIMGTMEFLPKTASTDFVGNLDSTDTQGLPKIVTNSSLVEISNLKVKTNFLSFNYLSTAPQTVLVNTLNFPNWHGYFNEQEFPIKTDSVGRISLDLPTSPTPSSITIKWQDSPIEILGNLVSFFSLLFFFIYLRYLSHQKPH